MFAILKGQPYYMRLKEAKGVLYRLDTRMTEIVQGVFYLDGSLRDIYIFDTDEHDWQMLLDFLHASTYSTEFLLAGEQHSLPGQIEEAFALVHKHGGLLRIDEENLALHCYFYQTQEIELDLDPRAMHSEQHISRLLDFVRTVGNLLNKPVVLTPENASWVTLFRFDPTTHEEKWYPISH